MSSTRRVHPAVGMGFVPACFEVVPYSRKETIQSDGFDGLKYLTVDPSRTTVIRSDVRDVAAFWNGLASKPFSKLAMS